MKFAVIPMVAVLSLLQGETARAQAPWEKLVLFKRIDADPNMAYPLTAENGPWTIMATTFHGDNAEQEARQLVYELRKVHKLSAYTYKKEYDYSGTVQGLGLNPDGSPKTMKYARDTYNQEIAVLVGDFESVDDPRAQKTLQLIKHMHPEALAIDKGKGTSQSFGSLRRLQQKFMKDEEDKKKGPMRHAIVTTNPLLPKEYFAPKGLDKLVIQMNENVTHSLLDCKGKYSVKIATFSGFIVLDQKQIERLESGEVQTKSRLEKAAMRAHKLTEALRAEGVEAYEFHDRNESIVTVGSFDSIGTKRPDGKIEINPQIHAIMQKYQGQQSNAAAKIQTAKGQSIAAGVQAQRIKGISLDIQPVPVEVPRRSIASDYRQVSYER